MSDDGRAPRQPDESAAAKAARSRSALRTTAVLSGAGFTMAASVAIGALGGNWADGRLHTAPWLLVVGFLLGTVAGFINMARIIAVASR